MTIAYSCILIAILLPYAWAMYAKTPFFKAHNYDNNSPRPLLESLEGKYQRANWAQQNAFEALPGFIAAVIIAHLAGASQSSTDYLAILFIAARVAHGICYIQDWATLRSFSWMIGIGSVIGLFICAF